MKKLFFSLLIISLLVSVTTPLAMAHCPLCTAGAAAGIGIARAYGLDDSIDGLFLGALIVSSALWADRVLKKRKIKFPMQQLVLIIVSFLLLAVPFYYKGLISPFDLVKEMPINHSMTGLGILGLSQFGVDKLLFGMIYGTFIVWGTFAFSDMIKKERGKVIFPYQGMVFMMIVLLILSVFLNSIK